MAGFVDGIATRLAELPGVLAVSLGGSRARGTHRPDSDWDLAIYYRDLDVVEHELAEARAGRFRVEPLLFHLAGIPTYVVVGELALGRVLRGELPRPEYPAALRSVAPGVWWHTAELVFGYARTAHAERGHHAQAMGLLVQAATQSAHAVLAARGEWVTNEKDLLSRAGLAEVENIVTEPGAVEKAHTLCADVVRRARGIVRPPG
jgi:hypothetical protein